jgi:GTP cyclohydrolase IA
MSYENTYNLDLAKKLAKADNPEAFLEDEIFKIKSRALQLNKARSTMAEGYKIVLEGLKMAFDDIDLDDPNLKDSPSRMARALIEISSGLGIEDEEIFSTSFPAENYNQVVILKDISFTSMCSHHFIPFTGVAHVGYLPDITPGHDGKVVGLSKLARIVDVHAQRPQLQERLSFNIMNAINTQLKPAGVMVVVQGNHGCLNCRGAKKENASMITSALEGQFKEDKKLREEFLSLIQHKC